MVTALLLGDGAAGEINPGWAATSVLGLLSTVLILVLRWLLYTWLPQERASKEAQIAAMLAAHAGERAEGESRRVADLAAAERRFKAAEERCEQNTERLIASLKEQGDRDRATFSREAAMDRDLFQRTAGQSFELLKYLAEREKVRAAAPCQNYKPARPEGSP